MNLNSDTIYLNLREWQEERPLEGRPLFQQYFKDDFSRSIAAEISRAGMLECMEMKAGLRIHTTSYVGHISLGNIQLTIQPKLIGTPLLNLFRYAYGLRDIRLLDRSLIPLKDYGLQEIFIFQLIQEVQEILYRGLHKKYVRISKDLKSPKGKLNVQRIARQAGPIGEQLPCVIYPRTHNIPHNQLLKAGLSFSSKITKDLQLKTNCRRLSALLGENISEVPLNYSTLKKVKIQSDRLTSAYEPAITIIEILLTSRGIALERRDQASVLPGFLFDMNRFFQTLISRFLHDNLSDYKLIDEYSIKGMMSYIPLHNPQNRRAPTPRPDFIIKKNEKIVSVLDAKYRDLWDKSLPREMLYQLAIYALSRVGGNRSIILYPTLNPKAKEAKIQINNPLKNDSLGQVIIRPVNLIMLESMITSPDSYQKRQEKMAFARNLVFGKT